MLLHSRSLLHLWCFLAKILRRLLTHLKEDGLFFFVFLLVHYDDERESSPESEEGSDPADGRLLGHGRRVRQREGEVRPGDEEDGGRDEQVQVRAYGPPKNAVADSGHKFAAYI